MEKNDSNLIWVDLEMSGLNPELDTILEICCVVSDKNLETFSESPAYSIYQPDFILENMDAWNTETHTRTGLIERCRNSKVTLPEAEQKILGMVSKYCNPGASPLCGNSVGTDKNFLKKYMPSLTDFIHYRIIDVSTVKELAKRWKPDPVWEKPEIHTAKDDILASIEELKFYRDHFFKT